MSSCCAYTKKEITYGQVESQLKAQLSFRTEDSIFGRIFFLFFFFFMIIRATIKILIKIWLTALPMNEKYWKENCISIELDISRKCDGQLSVRSGGQRTQVSSFCIYWQYFAWHSAMYRHMKRWLCTRRICLHKQSLSLHKVKIRARTYTIIKV